MFESTFEKIGRGVSKHSGKIIIIWIIVILLMGYGATLVFSNTNFNVQSSFGGGSGEAQTAQNLVTKYFPSSSSGNPNGTQILILTQGTFVNSSADYAALFNYQKYLNSTLNGTRGFTGVQSIIGTEHSTMLPFGSGMKLLLSGNAGATLALNGAMYQVNASSGIFLGTEALYLKSFSSSNGSLSSSYNLTVSELNAINIPYLAQQIKFLDAFTSSFNTSGSQMFTNTILDIQQSGQSTLKNTTFTNYLNNSTAFAPLISSSYSVIQNQNLTMFILHPNESMIDQTVIFFPYVTLPTGSGTQQLIGIITQEDKYTLYSASYLIFNNTHLNLTPSNGTIDHISNILTQSAAMNQFLGNPYFSANSNTLGGFLTSLNNESYSTAVNNSMLKFSLYNQPIFPTNYLVHNFVGYDNSTVLFVISFKNNYTTTQASTVTAITHKYLSNISGSSFYVAGTEQFASQLSNEITSGLVKAIAVGILLSILVIGVFFRSIKAAFIPILLFAISAIISLGIIGYIYTFVFHSQISFITPTLLFIFVLGLTSDYTVYIMARYRRELRHKTEHPTIITSRWAGHAIFTSGLTVIIAQLVLWLINIPFFSDSGFANAIGVFVSLMLATTFLPSLLHRYGKGIFKRSAEGKSVETDHRNAEKIGKFSTGNRYAMISIFLVIILVGVYVYQITPDSINILKLLPQSQAITAIQVINNTFNGDFLDRGFIIVGLAAPLIVNNHVNQTEMSTITAIENKTISSNGISEVLGPGRPFGYYTGYAPLNVPTIQRGLYSNQSNTFISSTNSSYVEIVFQTSYLGWGTKAINSVNSLNSQLQSSTRGNYTVQIGGLTESLSNAYSTTQSAFMELVPILSITIFALLAVQLSSIVSPTRLILMVIGTVIVALSIGYGIFHYIQGYPVIIFLPVFTFTTLLAVGVDYDVFMITRVREEIIKGNDIDSSIITSVKENGAVVMLLGTTLFVTFGALYFSSIPMMQQIGVGIALGVILDTFVSWQLFIPAFMRLLGRANWWPSRFGRSKGKE